MKLSKLQGQLIAHLQLDADIPLNEIAKKLGVREHRLQYAFSSLVHHQIIRKVPRIDLSRIGYTYAHVFFSVHNLGKARAQLKSFVKQVGVLYLAELGGEFQYELILAAKQPGEIVNFFEEKLAENIRGHAISASRSYEFYPKNYLSMDMQSRGYASISHMNGYCSIDDLDSKILSALSHQQILSLRDAARMLGVPFATVRLRTEKLKQKGVIQGFAYEIDPLDFEYNEFILLLYTKGLGRFLEQKLFTAAKMHPHVTHARALVGEWNFEVGIEVKQAQDIVQIVESLTEDLSEEVIKTRLLQRFRTLHFRPYPFYPG